MGTYSETREGELFTRAQSLTDPVGPRDEQSRRPSRASVTSGFNIEEDIRQNPTETQKEREDWARRQAKGEAGQIPERKLGPDILSNSKDTANPMEPGLTIPHEDDTGKEWHWHCSNCGTYVGCTSLYASCFNCGHQRCHSCSIERRKEEIGLNTPSDKKDTTKPVESKTSPQNPFYDVSRIERHWHCSECRAYVGNVLLHGACFYCGHNKCPTCILEERKF